MEILTKRAGRYALGGALLAATLLLSSCPLFWIGAYANENSAAGLNGDLVASAAVPRDDFNMENAFLGIASFPDSVVVVTKSHLYRYDAATLRLKATYICSPAISDGVGFDKCGAFDIWNTAVQGTMLVMNRPSPSMTATWLEFSIDFTLPDGNTITPSIVGVSGSTPTVPTAAGKFFYAAPGTSTSFVVGGLTQTFLAIDTSLCPQDQLGLMMMTNSNETAGWLSLFGSGPMSVVNGRVKGGADVYEVPLPLLVDGSFNCRRVAVDVPYPGTEYGYEKVDGFRYVSGRNYDIAMVKTWGRMQFTILDHSGNVLANIVGDEESLRGFAPAKGGYYVFRGGEDYGDSAPPSISLYRWP